tara:strand:+ start:924 stop:1199 length:276 start_codon:yes stop_codon:yes gene_type:complete
MDQKQRIAFSNIMSELYQKPEMIKEQWHIVSPMLTELIDTTPQGFEGVTSMINKHFTNAARFSDVKMKKFELESGLIKLNMYFQKLNRSKS